MTTVGQTGTDTGMSNMTSAQTEARSYPHAFFGISDKYIPTTIKEMYRWAQFIFQVNPIFSRIIHKQASYVTTELIYDCRSSQSEQLWKQMLEQVLGYKLFEKQMLLDYFTFGNAFCRFIFPKQRYLVCPKCETSYPIANIDYTFAGFRFRGTCTKCNYSGNLKAMDKPTRNRTQVKLIRIDPRYIQPIHEPITGATEYLYVVPKALASIIREGSKRKTKIRTILENVPLEVIDAVEKGHLIKFPKDTIYHLKWHSISRDDNSLGDIPFMPVFKVIWLYHTLWRAQEAVSLEHVLPWTFMSPESNSGGVEPLMNVDMSVWNSFMRETINRFRWDPNHIGLTPFPVRAINLRGDAKSLDNWQGLEHLKEVIAAGMGVPATFLFGGSTYCLSGETLVQTNKGLLSLKELAPEEQGQTHGLTNIQTTSHEGVRAVDFAHSTKEKPVWEVRTAFGMKLRGSADHRALVLRPDLSFEFVRFEDLRENDQIAFKAGQELWPTENPTKCSAEEARILGYLVSEGTTTQMCRRRTYRVSFDNTAQDVIDDYRHCVLTAFGEDRPVVWRNLPGSTMLCGHVDLYKIKNMRRLLELGLMPARADQKTVPKAIRTAPREIVVEFLKAYFTGDGGICCSGKERNKFAVVASSMSEQLLREIQLLLLNMGIVSSLDFQASHSPDGIWRLRITGKNIARYRREIGFTEARKQLELAKIEQGSNAQNREEKIPYLRERLSELRDANFPHKRGCIDRYGDKVRFHVPYWSATYQTIEEKADLDNVARYDEELAGRIDDLLEAAYYFAPVRTAQVTGEIEPMFDLTVAEAESYQANGLLTHNSSASVELRVLENDFRNIVLQLNSMLEDFVIPKLVRYFSIPREKIHHEKFKMADDVQQRQLMTTMQQTGTISEKTVATELGFNHDQEKKLIEAEMLEKARLQRIIQLADAETQVAVQKIMAKGQYAVQQIMQTGKDPEEDGAPAGATGFGNQDTQLTYTTNPTALKMQAQNFIKTRSPMQQDIELQQIRATNPEYARAIEDTRKTILNPPKLTALPNEQREGKKGPGKAAI